MIYHVIDYMIYMIYDIYIYIYIYDMTMIYMIYHGILCVFVNNFRQKYYSFLYLQ